MHLGKRLVQHLLAAQRIDLRQRQLERPAQEIGLLVARQIQYRPSPLVLPRPTDARQREAGIARLVEPDVDALAFGVERVGVGGQRDDFGLAIVADHGVVTGDRLMYIAEGNVGIGAFQPQRVPLARHAQNGVVGDGRCGEIARDMLVLRVDDGVERLDVAGGQHRVQVVGERLAVAEFIRIDRCGVHRLPASDAQLDAHVAGRASQIAVERLDFSPFVGDRVG